MANPSHDVMDSKRYRIKYRSENLYLVVVTSEDGQPFEIFANHASNGDYNVQYMLASWDCLTRFVSMSLQHLSLDRTLNQLRKSTRQSNDLPGIILRILQSYQPTTKVEDETISETSKI